MTETIPDPNNYTPRFRGAFAKMLAQIRNMPEDDFSSINIDVESSVATVLGSLAAIRGQREHIVKEAPSFDISSLDNLELYTLALGHAHTAYETATQPSPSLVAMGNDAMQRRTVMVSDINMLVSRGLLKDGLMSELKGINGYKNIAFDLFALSDIYRKNWDNIGERTSVKKEELDQVEDIADKLVTAAGEREQAPQLTAEAIRDRQAAFTIFINAYDEIRSVIGFIRRKQGDVDTIAPSLFLGRATGKKKDNGDKAQTPATTVPAATQPAAPVTNATPLANMAPVANAQVAATGPYVQ
jgi:hypothetical protein